MKCLLILLALIGFASFDHATCNDSVYVDAVGGNWAFWGWAGTVDLASTQHPHGGSRNIRWVPNGWDALYFHANTAVPSSSVATLEIWIHGGTVGGQTLSLAFNPNSGSPKPAAVSLQSYVPGGVIQANVWQKATINLAALGFTTGSIVEFWIQDTTGGTQGALYLDDIVFKSGTSTTTTTTTTTTAAPLLSVTINTGLNRRTIDQRVYGVNHAGQEHLASVKYPVNRKGGNSETRYNWEVGVSNKGQDWFYFNIADDVPNPSNLPEGSAADQFVDTSVAAGSTPLLTASLIGFTPVDNRAKKWGYSVAKYGSQTSNECVAANWASWCISDAGNGLASSTGQQITTNDYTDTSKVIDSTYVQQWMDHLALRGTPVSDWSLDNEPALWSSTHADLVRQGVTYGDMWNRTLSIAGAIKAHNPAAVTYGPVAWGWCEYFFSARDGCSDGPDKAAHGNLGWLDWYAKQVADHRTATGVTLVDYLDVHYYPQASGVSLSSAEDSATASRRLQSVKSLYSPTFVDGSWIPSPVNLIPRLQTIVATRLPSMKIAITEYNFGNDDIITAALATAEALAVFGREGVAVANRWVVPAVGSKVEQAFKLFLKYDGTVNGVVRGESVNATSSNIDVIGGYAVHDAVGKKLHVIAFNKATSSRSVSFNVADMPTLAATARVFRFSQAAPNLTQVSSNLAITGGTFTLSLPRWSASLVVIPLP